MSLTPKQENFCQKYIELGNASDAYRESYNTARMKPESINRSAKELLDNHKITARIAELKAEHRERHDITVDSLTEMLVEDRRLAHETANPSAAVSAVNALAKLHGLIVDKKEHTGKNGGPIQTDNTWHVEVVD